MATGIWKSGNLRYLGGSHLIPGQHHEARFAVFGEALIIMQGEFPAGSRGPAYHRAVDDGSASRTELGLRSINRPDEIGRAAEVHLGVVFQSIIAQARGVARLVDQPLAAQGRGAAATK